MNKLLQNKNLTPVQLAFVAKHDSAPPVKMELRFTLVLFNVVMALALAIAVWMPARVSVPMRNVLSVSVVLYAIMDFSFGGILLLVAIGDLVMQQESKKNEDKRWNAAKSLLSGYPHTQPAWMNLFNWFSKVSFYVFLVALIAAGHMVLGVFLILNYVGMRINLKIAEAATLAIVKGIEKMPPDGWEEKP